MTIFIIALIVCAIAFVVWRSVRYVKLARCAKRWCRASMNKWLLEKADECDLKAEDDTKTWPGPEAMV